jgi:hypothetical protein
VGTLGEELSRLRHGRGIMAGDLRERLGPTLRAIAEIDPDGHPDDIRQRLTKFLEEQAVGLPEDLRTAFEAALALREDVRHRFLEERMRWLADTLQRDIRTARRRADEAMRMVSNAPGGLTSSEGTLSARNSRGNYVLAGATTEMVGDSAGPRLPVPAYGPGGAVFLTEDEIKQGAKEYLEAAGFSVTVAWGRQRGIDIRAVSGAEVMLLAAKGTAVNPPRQVNCFLCSIGELLQRMSDSAATYGLALPDSREYRGLAGRLPVLAWQRLRLTMLFVSRDDTGQYAVHRVTTPS